MLRVGELYVHYKSGDIYRVKGTTKRESNGEDEVRYCLWKPKSPLGPPDTWKPTEYTRPLKEWFEVVKDSEGNDVPRFTPLTVMPTESISELHQRYLWQKQALDKTTREIDEDKASIDALADELAMKVCFEEKLFGEALWTLTRIKEDGIQLDARCDSFKRLTELLQHDWHCSRDIEKPGDKLYFNDNDITLYINLPTAQAEKWMVENNIRVNADRIRQRLAKDRQEVTVQEAMLDFAIKTENPELNWKDKMAESKRCPQPTKKIARPTVKIDPPMPEGIEIPTGVKIPPSLSIQSKDSDPS